MSFDFLNNLFKKQPKVNLGDLNIMSSMLDLPKKKIEVPRRRHLYLSSRPLPASKPAFSLSTLMPLFPATAIALLLIVFFKPSEPQTDTQSLQVQPNYITVSYIEDTQAIISSPKISTDTKVEILNTMAAKTEKLTGNLLSSKGDKTSELNQVKEIQNKQIHVLAQASKDEKLKEVAEKNVEALNNLISAAAQFEPDIEAKDVTLTSKGTVTDIKDGTIQVGEETFTTTGSTTAAFGTKTSPLSEIKDGQFATIEYTVKDGKRIAVTISSKIKPTISAIHKPRLTKPVKDDIIDSTEVIEETEVTNESTGSLMIEDPAPECIPESDCENK